MSELARVLPFPRREERTLSDEETSRAADLFLSAEGFAQSDEFKHRYLSDTDVLLTICSRLKEEREHSPNRAAEAAAELYELVFTAPKVGVFDERKYVLGELAHLIAAIKRIVGERESVEVWLSRAESAFRHTVNPTGSLTQVAYTRLALWYDMGRYSDVLEVLPDVTCSFEILGMERDAIKARLFHAMALKVVGRAAQSLDLLQALVQQPAVQLDHAIHGRILVDLGDAAEILGDHQLAISTFQKALPLLKAAGQPISVADLQMVVASTWRNLGRVTDAAQAYAEAKAGFAELGMRTRVAYVGVLRAETLLEASRHREAEWEILAALPTIEEQKMVPEGFAAVALLKESVRRRKADPNALRELREHLQANQ